MVSKGPSAVTPFILPRMSVASGAIGGAERTAALSTATTASNYDPSIAATITPTSVGGTLSGCATFAVVDAMGAANGYACSDVEGGITPIAGCTTTSEGDPSAAPIG